MYVIYAMDVSDAITALPPCSAGLAAVAVDPDTGAFSLQH